MLLQCFAQFSAPYLKNPSHFLNDPLHGPQVEQHGSHKTEKVDGAEHPEEEHHVGRRALVYFLGHFICYGRLVQRVQFKDLSGHEVAVDERGAGVGVGKKLDYLEKGRKTKTLKIKNCAFRHMQT